MTDTAFDEQLNWVHSKLNNAPEHETYVNNILQWVHEEYPDLEPVIKWNQPMYLLNGTFIIGFSVASKHMSIAPEGEITDRFRQELEETGMEPTKKFCRFFYNKEPRLDILKLLIDTNIREKQNCTSFWRP
ncbi:MAG: DUF1801 domain-containing protein [Bifidobacteriaceae bacterium]|nr:DUF1801 domain-containing protein [Bifidobacteriaceae bacterium]